MSARASVAAAIVSVAMASFALAAAISTGACSLLVDGELGAVACSDEGALGPPSCPDGMTCLGGACSSARAARLGSGCARDSDCAPLERCADLGGELGCTARCCSSADCGDPADGFVCGDVELDGGRLCRRASDLGRQPPGDLEAGSSCATSDACRSGDCASLRCRDTCCTDANCRAQGSACRSSGDPGASGIGEGLMCSPASGGYGALDPCSADVECASGICEPVGPAYRCVEPCCSSSACGQLSDATGTWSVACIERARGTVPLRVCAGLVPKNGERPVGASCDADEQCRTGRCESAGGGRARACTDACCADASCGDGSLRCFAPPDEPLRCGPK